MVKGRCEIQNYLTIISNKRNEVNALTVVGKIHMFSPYHQNLVSILTSFTTL